MDIKLIVPITDAKTMLRFLTLQNHIPKSYFINDGLHFPGPHSKIL